VDHSLGPGRAIQSISLENSYRRQRGSMFVRRKYSRQSHSAIEARNRFARSPKINRRTISQSVLSGSKVMCACNIRHRLSGMVEISKAHFKPAVLAQAMACTHPFNVIRHGVYALRLPPLIFHPTGPNLTPKVQSTCGFYSPQHPLLSSACSLQS